MSKKSPPLSGPEAAAKRVKVERKLLSTGKCTRSGLVACLAQLEEAGLLVEGASGSTERQVRREIQRAIESHSHAQTPYGTVVQTMDLGTNELRRWEYVNPFAFLYHLTSISHGFAAMMVQCIGDGSKPLRLILYLDELNPGNPLRPDKGRATQDIYWCFADWPQWALQSSEVWLIFGVLRTSLMEGIPAGASGLMRAVMNTFYPAAGTNFLSGCLIKNGLASVLLRAEFAGFVADEKAHKEIMLVKGASGTKSCPTCKNLVNRMDLPKDHTYLVGLDCCDVALLDRHTNETFFEMVDRLRAAKAAGMSKTKFAELERILGLSYNEAGLMYDDRLRTILKPIDHCIRDWMHTLVSGGVAGTEMSLLLQAMKSHGVGYDKVQSFAKGFTLPTSRGKVNLAWFSDARIGDDQLRSFASEQLNMLPILLCFVIEVVEPLGIMPMHIASFLMLYDIVEILSMGPHASIPHLSALSARITEHHEAFKLIYPGFIKPKWHHMLHIPDNMKELGVLLSCFVTERKHRIVKNAACHVFRHYEHTVLADLVNRQAQDFADGKVLQRWNMLNPKTIHIEKGVAMQKAAVASLPCGEVRTGDLVALRGRRVGRLIAFWSDSAGEDAEIAAQFVEYRLSSVRGPIGVVTSTEVTCFSDVAEIIGPLVWASRSDSAITVVLPRLWFL